MINFYERDNEISASIKAEKFVQELNINFSRKTLHHGASYFLRYKYKHVSHLTDPRATSENVRYSILRVTIFSHYWNHLVSIKLTSK
jgi:hypothetical protein